MALTKKSLDNFLPNGFETQNQKGYKANFTADRILTGYDKDTLEVLSGPNLNNLIDVTGKNFNTLNDLLKYFNDMPIDSFPIVNASNQLDYKSINSFFRNVGELVFSAVPIDDKNLKLLDGAILDGAGTYRVFVSFISKMVDKFPNLFLTENEWQAQVNKYGVCGKFVWDAVKNTLRIPKVSGIIEATLDPSSIGNVVEAGLPNITGSVRQISESYLYSGTADGAFAKVDAGWSAGTPRHTDGTAAGSVDFNAARSNATYGKSNTVQPQTIKQYIYMVVSVDTEETQKLTSVFQYRGSVPTFADLPKEGNLTGDVWNVDDTDINYVWDGQEWDQLSGTVDLTGYYTKDECDLKFAEQTSLASNVEKLQGQITQNKTDISIISSGKTIESAVEQMKGSKFLENKGAIGTYANVYNDIEKYYHSTFDKSKFTIVGSPNITNDGNLSDVGRGSYVRTPFEFNPQGAWEINVKANIDTSIKQQIIGASKVYHCVNLREEANGRLILSLSSNGTSFDISDAMSSVQDRIQTNTDYFYKIKFDTKQYTVAISTDNKIWKTIITVNSSLKVIKDYLQLGLILDGNNPLVKGSIDLKQFSISVDGKEVFNGNKTGIDILKPDNFTKIGDPVISDDGIASGFSKTNYIEKKFGDLGITDNFELIFKFRYLPSDKTQTIFLINDYYCLLILTNGNIQLRMPVSDNKWFLTPLVYKPDDIYIGKYVYVKLVANKVGFTPGYFSGDGVNWQQVNNYSSQYNDNWILNNKTCTLGANKYNNEIKYNGDIDFNETKIKAKNEIVDQLLLRVPYHETAQGFKIAPATARNRVIGMYEQYGYSQYFTIDEENKNYTLPCGANPSGRQDLISSFDDGTNKVEQFSDLTVKQSGNCTANQPVVLMKPYRDDKYKISVPYSSKTKTGFTPTQSGNWFAEGKIYLD